MTRRRPTIALTLSDDTLAILDTESARTGLPRARIVEILLLRPDVPAILDADDSDTGRTLIEYDGRVQSMRAWSRELGIPASTIRQRLRAGRPVEEVLSTEPLPLGRPRNTL